jgi:Tfp pilus assembly protein PilO
MKHLLRFHIVGTVVALVVLVVFAGGLIVFIRAIQQRETRVLEVRDRLASFEQNKKIFSEETKEFESIRERIIQLESNIITEASIPALLSSLEGIAKAQGVDFEITAVNTVVPVSDPTRSDPLLQINFSASGGFANLQSVVEQMQSQRYQVVFDEFSLFMISSGGGTQTRSATSGEGKGAQWQLLARMSVLSF